MPSTLNSLSDKLLITYFCFISVPLPLGFLSCSSIWHIVLSVLILVDFLYLFLLIRQNIFLFWF